MPKPSWPDYFFSIAKVVSSRSTCPSRSVGCVIVDPGEHSILATGYNASAKGVPPCGEACENRVSGSSFEKCQAVHAEANAIVQAAKNGVSTKGAHMYLTTTPCVFCSRLIINAGIKEVWANSAYPQKEAIDLLVSAGIKVIVEQGVPLPNLKFRKENDEVQRVEYS